MDPHVSFVSHNLSLWSSRPLEILDTQIERIGKPLRLNDRLTGGTEFFGETHEWCGNGGHRYLQVKPGLNSMLF